MYYSNGGNVYLYLIQVPTGSSADFQVYYQPIQIFLSPLQLRAFFLIISNAGLLQCLLTAFLMETSSSSLHP